MIDDIWHLIYVYLFGPQRPFDNGFELRVSIQAQSVQDTQEKLNEWDQRNILI